MIRKFNKHFIFMILCFVATLSVAFADIDPVDYQVYVKPNFVFKDNSFSVKNKSYEVFTTPKYNFDKPMDNMIVSVDIDKAKTATVKCLVRVKFEADNRWSQYKQFQSEFFYSNFRTIIAYQLSFTVLDKDGGETSIKRFTVQAKRLGKEKMIKFLAIDNNAQKYKAEKAWTKPEIVSRKAWGAKKPKGPYTKHHPKRIIIHHSYIPTQAQYRGASTIRGIQNYHMNDSHTHWNDIGYHFLIGPEGKIYQGRPETVVGAHCSPNTNAVGICIIGDYDPEHDNVNSKIEGSLINLLSWLCSKYNIDPKTKIYGHRDYSPKTCPGDKVYYRFSYYRQHILTNIGTKK